MLELNPLDELPLQKPGRKHKEPEVGSDVEQDSPDFFGPPGPPVLKCERCDAVVEEGKKHQCSKREFRERLIEKVTVAHPKSGAMAAAAVVKSKATSPKGTKYLAQAKGGRHLPINIGHAPDTQSPKISTSQITSTHIFVKNISLEIILSGPVRFPMFPGHGSTHTCCQIQRDT